MTHRVSITEVARELGLSVTTVSLVLNHKPGTRIAPATAQRVIETARKMGYTPNPTARTLRTGKSMTFGLLSDQVTVTRYASPIISGAIDAGHALGYMILIAEAANEPGDLGAAADLLVQRGVDGLVVALMAARHIDLPPLPDGLPVAIVNGVTDDPAVASVLPDEDAGGHLAASVLLEAGHRDIALIGRSPRQNDPTFSVTVSTRFAGIDRALAEAGVTPTGEYAEWQWEPDAGYHAAESLLADPERRPTALIVGNDRLALGVYTWAQSHGVAIGRDLSIVSFDDEPLAGYLRPGLTTVKIPYARMGACGVNALIDQSAQGGCQLVPMPLITRESVGTPRR